MAGLIPSPAQALGGRWRAALGHLGLALLVVWPGVLAGGSRLLGDPRVDVWNHAWGAWYWYSALREGRLPWRTELLIAPEGGVLWFIDPAIAALGAPLVPVLGVAMAWNLGLWAVVAFASWAGRAFARELGASEAASWVGAAALACSAWVVCELHNGISEAVNVGPAALALAWTHRALREASWGAWARAGLGVGLCAWASPYLALGVGLVALARGLPGLREAWVGALSAAVVGLPPALALATQLRAEDAVIKRPLEMDDQLALHNAVDPRIFVTPLGFRSVDLSAEGFEHSAYLGLVALGLAAWGLWQLPERRRALGGWALAGLLALVLCLGPYLAWGGEWARTPGGGYLRLPWWWVRQGLGGLAITHPLRLAVPGLVVVAGLAAVGAGALPGRRAVWAALGAVLLDGLLLSGAPWPVAAADARVPAVYTDLTRPWGDPAREVLLDLPTDLGATMGSSRYLYWQTAHRRPIPYTPDVRASTSPLLRRASFRYLASTAKRRPDEHARLGFEAALPEHLQAVDLRLEGVRWVVVHPALDPEGAAALRPALEAALGPPVERDGAWRWDLGGGG